MQVSHGIDIGFINETARWRCPKYAALQTARVREAGLEFLDEYKRALAWKAQSRKEYEPLRCADDLLRTSQNAPPTLPSSRRQQLGTARRQVRGQRTRHYSNAIFPCGASF